VTFSSFRVRTGSRLHFGLIDPGGRSGRFHGGAGVMVEEPGVEVVASRGGSRTELEIVRCPRRHAGLGTGTQLALAHAAAVEGLDGLSRSAVELARSEGRGARSAIGVHGFEHGGFLVDGGKRPADRDVAPLLARFEVPEEWRFLIIVPPGIEGVHGRTEKEVFRSLAAPAERDVDALCRILLLGMLPALVEGDLASFGAALHDFGRLAAGPFRKAQGGIYAGPLVSALVGHLRQAGAAGAGQSSWGPATYAVAEDADAAQALAEGVRRRFALVESEVIVTAARNRGACRPTARGREQ
jgi:beta-ribofuranosylaminobenzene 5'-phosphate synthase